eukprot:g15323.t1
MELARKLEAIRHMRSTVLLGRFVVHATSKTRKMKGAFHLCHRPDLGIVAVAKVLPEVYRPVHCHSPPSPPRNPEACGVVESETPNIQVGVIQGSEGDRRGREEHSLQEQIMALRAQLEMAQEEAMSNFQRAERAETQVRQRDMQIKDLRREPGGQGPRNAGRMVFLKR